jgi:hypothetical protein
MGNGVREGSGERQARNSEVRPEKHKLMEVGESIKPTENELRVKKSYDERIRGDLSRSPGELVKKFMEEEDGFSFAIHPLTGMAIIADREEGHDNMMTENAIMGDMQKRLSLGALNPTEEGFEIQITKSALIQGMKHEDVVGKTIRILQDLGVPRKIQVKDDIPREKITQNLVERGKTPGGKNIPSWQGRNLSPSEIQRIKSNLIGQIRQTPDRKTQDALMDEIMRLEKPGNAVGEGEAAFEKDENGRMWAYTKFPIVAVGGMHVRAARAIGSSVEGSYEVFHNIEGTRGEFVPGNIGSLVDNRQGNVTSFKPGGQSGLDVGELIVRAKTRGEKIPDSIASIARVIRNNRIFQGETSKGD